MENNQKGILFIKEQKERLKLETKLDYYTDKCYKLLSDVLNIYFFSLKKYQKKQ